MPAVVIDDILDAYHRAYQRFLFYVTGEQNDAIPLAAFPLANIVLTQNPDVFRRLYHTPSRYDRLPKWVTGYVNFMKSCFVMLVSSGMSIDINGCAHEFTHAIIPHVLGLPADFLYEFWPTWVSEVFTVGANQRQPREWVRREIEMMITFPSTALIEKDGIFAMD